MDMIVILAHAYYIAELRDFGKNYSPFRALWNNLQDIPHIIQGCPNFLQRGSDLVC